MTLSFAERMKLKQQGQAVSLSADPTPVQAPKEEKPSEQAQPVRRFGQPKVVEEPKAVEPSPAPASTGGFRRFGQGLGKPSGGSIVPPADSSVPVAEEGPKEEAPQEVEEVPAPLPKVIQVFNQATAAGKGSVATNGQTEGELLSGAETPEAVRMIQAKIQELEQTPEVDLRYEMQKLQPMLIANPSACLYLLDEDLGLMVRALRRMTGNRVAIDMAQAKPSAKAKAATSKPLSASEMESAFDDL